MHSPFKGKNNTCSVLYLIMDAHWLGIFFPLCVSSGYFCGANFCLFTSSGQHGHETNIYVYHIPSSN